MCWRMTLKQWNIWLLTKLSNQSDKHEHCADRASTKTHFIIPAWSLYPHPGRTSRELITNPIVYHCTMVFTFQSFLEIEPCNAFVASSLTEKVFLKVVHLIVVVIVCSSYSTVEMHIFCLSCLSTLFWDQYKINYHKELPMDASTDMFLFHLRKS